MHLLGQYTPPPMVHGCNQVMQGTKHRPTASKIAICVLITAPPRCQVKGCRRLIEPKFGWLN